MSQTQTKTKITGMADFFIEGLPEVRIRESTEPKYSVIDVDRKLKLYFDDTQHLRAFVGKLIEALPK